MNDEMFIPNSLFDRVMELGGAEVKVWMYIYLYTRGMNKVVEQLTLDQLTSGTVDRFGTRLDNGTGLSRRAVQRGIQRLIDLGLLTKIEVSGEGSLFAPVLTKKEEATLREALRESDEADEAEPDEADESDECFPPLLYDESDRERDTRNLLLFEQWKAEASGKLLRIDQHSAQRKRQAAPSHSPAPGMSEAS